MSFLLDTDICSAHMRRPSHLFHRFSQHSGRLWIASVGLAELYTWAYKQHNPSPILAKIQDFLQDVSVVPFDQACALQVGKLRGEFLRTGICVSAVDLMIASVALVNDLTLVTHNVSDFQKIPGLRVVDWLRP